MRYSFYYKLDDDVFNCKLFFESTRYNFDTYEDESVIKQYTFCGSKTISNEPGVTRLFGDEVIDKSGDYYLYPISLENVETGYFDLNKSYGNYIEMNFHENVDENLQPIPTLIKGNWILRFLKDGRALFWKPYPVVYQMPQYKLEINSASTENVNQEFGIFQTTTAGKQFEGHALVEGLWTGMDGHTTLFTASDIEGIYKNMKNSIAEQVVDYNHNHVNSGNIIDVSLEDHSGKKAIFLKGTSEQDVPENAGLSIGLDSVLSWNEQVGAYVHAETPKPSGVSILTNMKPACKICMVR